MGLAGPEFPPWVFFLLVQRGNVTMGIFGKQSRLREPSPRPLAALLRPLPHPPATSPRGGTKGRRRGADPGVGTPIREAEAPRQHLAWGGSAMPTLCRPHLHPHGNGAERALFPWHRLSRCPLTGRGTRRPPREQGRGAAALTGPTDGAGASPGMLRDSEEGSPLSALLLLLLLLPAPRAPVGAGQAGSKRFAASVLPAFTPGQCDSYNHWKWEKQELSPFFFPPFPHFAGRIYLP